MTFSRATQWAGCNQILGDSWSVAHAASLNCAAAGTLEFWVYVFTNDLTAIPVFVCKGKVNTAYLAFLSAGDNFTGRVVIGTVLKDAVDPVPIPRNTWTHYAMRWNSSVVQVVKNGAQVATTAAVGAIDTNANPLRFGDTEVAKTNSYAGLIYDARLWNAYRDDATILANKGVALVGNEANLVANWFIESETGIGVTVQDRTSNNFDLTAKQSHQWSSNAGLPY